MRLYEMNYAKLVRLLPKQQQPQARCSYDIQGQVFDLVILEVTTYTTLVTIEMAGRVSDYLRPQMQVRLYHDARVAEVCASQQIARIKARYDYPNRKMHQVNEKQQINTFLSDWLFYCTTRGIMVSY